MEKTITNNRADSRKGTAIATMKQTSPHSQNALSVASDVQDVQAVQGTI